MSFKNLSFLVKITIPLALTFLVAAGLVAYARSSMGTLAAQTREIVNVQAARQRHVLRMQAGLTEAAVQNRNILLERSASKMAGYTTRQQAAIRSTLESQADLAALADSPERVARNAKLLEAVNTYFAVLARSTDAGLKNDNETGMKIAQEEAAPYARNCARRSRSGSMSSIKS